MYRSIFYLSLFIFLSILSFSFTLFSISYLKNLDPIMKEIKNNISLYKVDSVNAYVDDLIVIPGVSGKDIDMDTSYKLMKNYGSFKKDLIVYNKSFPKISINNIYDKYVVSGNLDKKEVSLIFKIEDTNYLEEIIVILKDNAVIGTFFIDEEIFLESKDVIDLLYLNNQDIEFLSKEYKLLNIEKFDYLLRNYINKTINFCYLDYYDKKTLNICSFKKMHTIIPSINTSNYPYYDIKNKLSNGSIIKLNNNSRVLYELDFIINFIRQKDYKIVSLKKLLSE